MQKLHFAFCIVLYLLCGLCDLCGNVFLGSEILWRCAFVRERRIVFDAEAGAVFSDADVENADGAEPAEQVDWIE